MLTLLRDRAECIDRALVCDGAVQYNTSATKGPDCSDGTDEGWSRCVSPSGAEAAAGPYSTLANYTANATAWDLRASAAEREVLAEYRRWNETQGGKAGTWCVVPPLQ